MYSVLNLILITLTNHTTTLELNPKMNFMSFTHPFFLLWNTQEDSLKNVGNQAVLFPIDFHCMVKNIMGTETVSYQHSSNYLLLCSTQQRKGEVMTKLAFFYFFNEIFKLSIQVKLYWCDDHLTLAQYPHEDCDVMWSVKRPQELHQ